MGEILDECVILAELGIGEIQVLNIYYALYVGIVVVCSPIRIRFGTSKGGRGHDPLHPTSERLNQGFDVHSLICARS